jgi:hypothetical protein
MTKMATKRQTFALFCITKKDYRNENLTYEQASNLIKELGNPNYIKKGKNKVTVKNDVVDWMNEAKEAGMVALNECKPTPMVVEQHVNVMNDNSPVKQAWVVDGGVCGFCSIIFKANTTVNRRFLAGLKKAGLAGEDKFENKNVVWSKSYNGGFSYWVSEGGQSLERKEAFGHAFASVLEKHGVTVRVNSRMD